jgi:hypothetical protein
MFLSSGCSLLRAEGFFCSLYVLYGGLLIDKMVVFDQNRYAEVPVQCGTYYDEQLGDFCVLSYRMS